MSVLTDIRDHLKTVVADAEAEISKRQAVVQVHNELVAKLDAEIAKVPTIDDVRSLLDRISADSATTKQ